METIHNFLSNPYLFYGSAFLAALPLIALMRSTRAEVWRKKHLEPIADWILGPKR